MLCGVRNLGPYTCSPPAYLSLKKCHDRVIKGKLAVHQLGQSPMLFNSYVTMQSFVIGRLFCASSLTHKGPFSLRVGAKKPLLLKLIK
jgi:hypothetical protein